MLNVILFNSTNTIVRVSTHPRFFFSCFNIVITWQQLDSVAKTHGELIGKFSVLTLSRRLFPSWRQMVVSQCRSRSPHEPTETKKSSRGLRAT